MSFSMTDVDAPLDWVAVRAFLRSERRVLSSEIVPPNWGGGPLEAERIWGTSEGAVEGGMEGEGRPAPALCLSWLGGASSVKFLFLLP
jgi:hypothetical protein